MGRLKPELLERSEAFADRVLDVVETLANKQMPRRIVDQLAGSGTSVGANLAEADEAMSTKDFRKCISIAAKELTETRFWLRLVARREWIGPGRLQPLLAETDELKRILGAILHKTRPDGPVGAASSGGRPTP